MFNGSVINDSPTLCAAAGAEIKGGPFTAVAYSGGALVQCTDALVPVGITIAETDADVVSGDDVHFQIKDIGMWKSGAAFAAGTALSCDANGCAITAAAGKYVLGYALEESTVAGQYVKVQITKSGYAPAA